MGLLASGKIDGMRGWQEALALALSVPHDCTILCITSADAFGSLLIVDSKYIEGALALSHGETGTQAVSLLLGVANGTYSFFEPDSQTLIQELDHKLHLPIEQLLELVSAKQEASAHLAQNPASARNQQPHADTSASGGVVRRTLSRLLSRLAQEESESRAAERASIVFRDIEHSLTKFRESARRSFTKLTSFSAIEQASSPEMPQQTHAQQLPVEEEDQTTAISAAPQVMASPATADMSVLPANSDQLLRRLRSAPDRVTESQKLRLTEIDAALAQEDKEKRQRLPIGKRTFICTALAAMVGGGWFAKSWHDSQVVERYISQAQDYVASDKKELAVVELGQAIARQPASLKALEMRASLYEQSGQLGEALADYEVLKRLDPGFASSRAALARALVLYKLGHYEQTEAATDESGFGGLDDAQMAALKGMSLARLGLFERALPLLAHPPSDLKAFAAAAEGYALFHLKSYDQALAAYARAVQADPHSVQARRERAIVEESLRDYADAILDLRRACRLAPDSGENFALLGEAYAQLHENRLSVRAYRTAVALGFKPQACCLEIARLQTARQDFADAIDACDHALVFNSNDMPAKRLKNEILELSARQSLSR